MKKCSFQSLAEANILAKVGYGKNLKISYMLSNRYVARIEWLDDFFPKYCSGSTYIMSPGNSKKIFASFEATMKKYYVWIEDVYITGTVYIKTHCKNS